MPGPTAHLSIQDNSDFDSPYSFLSDEELSGLSYTPFPDTPLRDALLYLIKSYSSFADEEDPVEIRLVITGDDTMIHRFVCAYMSIALEHPDLLKGILLRIHLVPFQNCAIAGYIARYDAWWNRHIYSTFNEHNALIPWVSFLNSGLNEPSSDNLIFPPNLFLRDCIECYVREANHVLPIRLYQVEGWYAVEKKKNKQDVSTRIANVRVPLVHSVEIGLYAELKWHAKSNGIFVANDKELLDLKNSSRDFKFQFHDLKVEFTKIDLSGREYDVQLDNVPAVPFTRISISNFPSNGAPYYAANPRDPALELFARPQESKARQRYPKHWALTDPNQHITEAIISASSGNEFRILVDGLILGPFSSIRISPIEIQERHMSLPISTYFPIP
jgi:hypothetical protein